MSLIGSGERVVVLGDRISTVALASVGSDIPTPTDGRVVVFLHTDGVGGTPSGVYSKDSDGVVMALGGGAGSESGWRTAGGGNPTLTGDIVHEGGAAIGVPTATPLPVGTSLLVDKASRLGNTVYLGETGGATDATGYSQVFAGTDHGLYAKPYGAASRRIDSPGLTRKAIPSGDTLTVPDGCQYITYGTFTLGAGATLDLQGDAEQIVL